MTPHQCRVLNDISSATHTSAETAAGLLTKVAVLLAGKQAKLLNIIVKNI